MTSDNTIPPLPSQHAIYGLEMRWPPVSYNPCQQNSGFLKEATLVVSIPNDHELFIGKELVPLVDLIARTNRLLQSKPCECREVFVKVADSVTYRSLAPVIERLRAACVNKIGLVGTNNIVSKRAKID